MGLGINASILRFGIEVFASSAFASMLKDSKCKTIVENLNESL